MNILDITPGNQFAGQVNFYRGGTGFFFLIISLRNAACNVFRLIKNWMCTIYSFCHGPLLSC